MVSFIPGWNFSPASETNPLKTKLSITWRGIQPGLKILARYSQTGLGFSAWPNGPGNLKKSHEIETEFQHGPKKEREHAPWLCFCTSVNFLTEICVLRPGWNWACNHNNISARWAGRNFSPGWNSPRNQALRKRNMFSKESFHIFSVGAVFAYFLLLLLRLAFINDFRTFHTLKLFQTSSVLWRTNTR